jgi:hypothetical protein
MISFRCPECLRKYTVADEFAGRKTSCKACSTRLVVPNPEDVKQQNLLGAAPVLLPPPVRHPAVLLPPMIQPEVHPLDAPVVLCPFCEAAISPSARKCRHCGEILDVTLRAAQESRAGTTQQQVVIHQASPRYRRSFPTTLHLLLTFFSCGLWLPVWLIHYVVWISVSPRHREYD